MRRRLPPLNALRAFEASARHLNFRLAAEELGVTQGAVAQHVRGLEADLGTRLFERRPRTLALTDEGRRYAGALRRAFEIMAEATSRLRPEPRRLTVSVPPSFAAKWLLPRLPAFTAAHPDIELRIVASEALANFRSDGIDLAVRLGRAPFGPGLVADLLFEQEVIAVCGPALLDGARQALDPEDLARFTLLDDGHGLWPEFAERALGISLPPGARHAGFNQTALAIDAALAGQGIALSSRLLVEQDIGAGRLLQAFEPALRSDASFFVVTPRTPAQPKPCGRVRDWLLGMVRPC